MGKEEAVNRVGHRGQRLVSSKAGPESPLTLFAAAAGGVPALTPAGEISSQLPTSPNSGLGMTQTQVHSARASAGRYAQPSPHNLQEAPVSSVGVLPGPTCSFPYLLLRGAGLGWGLTVLAGSVDASRGRDRNLRRKTLS